MNYQKTQEVLEKAGIKYTKTAQQLKEENWFNQVKNPMTDNYLQWSDLKEVGIDAPDHDTLVN